MTEIQKKVKLFQKQYTKERTVKSFCDALDKLGYTVVFFNAISNEKEVNVLIDHLGLESLIRSQRGFTYATDKYRLVFINEDLAEEEKLVVMAHEIGHIYLRHVSKANIIGNDVIEEHEANEFSHYLLYKSNRTRMVVIISIAGAALLTLIIALSSLKSEKPVETPKTPINTEEKEKQTEENETQTEENDIPKNNDASNTVIDNRQKTKEERIIEQLVYGISFNLPASWGKRKSSDDGKNTWYYPEDGMLMITHGDSGKDDNNLSDDDIDGLISGISSSTGGADFKLINREKTTVRSDGREASMIEFYQTIHDMYLHIYSFTFCHNGEIISFLYADYPYAEEDRTDIFLKILDSIRIDNDNTAEKVEPKNEKTQDTENTDSSEASETLSQQNAMTAARNYLNISAFSRKRLINQLSSNYGDGYPVEDAEYAVKHLEDTGSVIWDEQAVKAAKNYLAISAFSHQGLVDQLTSEYGDQFTNEQAQYAVSYLEDNGLVDWNEQAVKSAQNYMEFGSFSRAKLMEQLTSEHGEGFTEEQAEYALEEIGF